MHSFDLSMDHITKVEGTASLDVRVRDGKVEHVHYQITEAKRFYTNAIEGKHVAAVPQLLSRICGTCSNAHIMAAIEACERALGVTPSPQTMLLRHLTMYGLNIRDHALHLYLFSMPDLFGKDAFLDFDEDDELQHQMLHDGFEIKAAGNFLAELIAGRSVHATYPGIGGFMHFPDKAGLDEAAKKLEAARPAVLRLIKIFEEAPFHFDRHTRYMALVPDGGFGFLDGTIVSSDGERITEDRYAEHLEHVVLPYSQASAYTHEGEPYMVGALARVNLAKDRLHPRTREAIPATLAKFPSTDIFHNNLAQAVEILHCIDHALEIMATTTFAKEAPVKAPPRAGEGVGVIEAPRGTLYHRVVLDAKGFVTKGQVIVPTGQNHVNIERDLHAIIDGLLPDADQEKIAFESEKLIRAYDPCMSCSVHFLKLRMDGEKRS